ncbi:MAG: hypothetical protein HXX20_00310 [Chloroflexi bacterium]|nr:hypothetical protein [Chloroflexota bacterium]
MISNNLWVCYEMSINFRVEWQAHSLSNAGSNGSNRLLPRRQLLADGTETDACSGNIAKHHHAVLLAEHFEAVSIPLCPACRNRDGRRAAALINLTDYKELTIERILKECGLCDAHGFLVTSKNAASDGSTETRQRLSKHSLVEFSYALALPGHHTETTQIATRNGSSKEDGQMIMKMPSRSGQYSRCVRYRSVGIGVDTDKWKLVVNDEEKRILRHQAILRTLMDSVLSPEGALTATMLPHLTGLNGAIVIRTTPGRAAIYSALEPDFITLLVSLEDDTCRVFPFTTITEFSNAMKELIKHSIPALPSQNHLGANKVSPTKID